MYWVLISLLWNAFRDLVFPWQKNSPKGGFARQWVDDADIVNGDVIKLKRFPYHMPLMRRIHRSPGFPSQRDSNAKLGGFLVVSLKTINKELMCRWFEPTWLIWRCCNIVWNFILGIYWWTYSHWKSRVVLMPTLSLLGAPEVVTRTNPGAPNDDKVGIIITIEFRCNMLSKIR